MKKFILLILGLLAFGCVDISGIPELDEELVEFEKTYTSLDNCQEACEEQNFMVGECKWPSKADRSHVSIGSCVAESTQCMEKGKCNCYCYNITSYEEYAVD